VRDVKSSLHYKTRLFIGKSSTFDPIAKQIDPIVSVDVQNNEQKIQSFFLC